MILDPHTNDTVVNGNLRNGLCHMFFGPFEKGKVPFPKDLFYNRMCLDNLSRRDNSYPAWGRLWNEIAILSSEILNE